MEQKNNAGSLFKNGKKDKPTAPDYTGTAVISDKKYRLSAWINKSKSGQNYLRIIFGEVVEVNLNQEAGQTKMTLRPKNLVEEYLNGNISLDNKEDDLPF